MSTYRLVARVRDDVLSTERSLTAPDAVVTLFDSAVWDLVNSGGALSDVRLQVDTPDDSGTPIGDGIGVESSEPLPGGRRRADEADDDVEVGDEVPTLAEPTAPIPTGQA